MYSRPYPACGSQSRACVMLCPQPLPRFCQSLSQSNHVLKYSFRRSTDKKHRGSKFASNLRRKRTLQGGGLKHPRGRSLACAPVLASGDATDDQKVLSATKAWVDKFIIGYNICPFAAKAMRQTFYVVSQAENDEQLEEELSKQMDILFTEYSTDTAATTLFMIPTHAALDFYCFMTHHLELASALLEKKLLQDQLQVVPFHPKAEYSDMEEDPWDYVSRSPFPTLHLLRQIDVEHAEQDWVDKGRNPTAITEGNEALLRGLGMTKLRSMMQDVS